MPFAYLERPSGRLRIEQSVAKECSGNLLPEQFTMQELQTVYEAILDTKLHRSAFQRKLLASDQLIRHEKRFTGKAHKAPYLYSFKR